MIKLLVFIGFTFFNSPLETDSLGVETINGKVFVIHKVEEKETLYAISRRYGATVDAIKQYNAAVDAGLEIGQILKVPYTPRQTKPADASIHKVAPKETLFSIARMYGVSMDDLKQWNNLKDNALVIGQELVIRKKNSSPAVQSVQASAHTAGSPEKGMHIVQEKETLYSIARQFGITIDQVRQWNNLTGNELKIGQILIVAEQKQPATATVSTVKKDPVVSPSEKKEPVTEPVQEPSESKEVEVKEPAEVKKEEQPVIQEPIRISESVKDSNEIVEGGLAELIEGTEGNRKYLALHRTAPVGTILKVRNEMNNREVFVRVMGKLPDTALTDKLVIKISKSAYDRLGAIDPRFRVEITYYK
jgi:LysM repeat protein